jgi:hypothetical protein
MKPFIQFLRMHQSVTQRYISRLFYWLSGSSQVYNGLFFHRYSFRLTGFLPLKQWPPLNRFLRGFDRTSGCHIYWCSASLSLLKGIDNENSNVFEIISFTLFHRNRTIIFSRFYTKVSCSHRPMIIYDLPYMLSRLFLSTDQIDQTAQVMFHQRAAKVNWNAIRRQFFLFLKISANND